MHCLEVQTELAAGVVIDSIVIFTDQLVQIAPVYYVDGNHEEDAKSNAPEIYTKLNEALVDLGAVHVENEIVSFTVKSGAMVNLCGINKHYFWGDEEQALMGALRKMDGVIVLACRYSESVI